MNPIDAGEETATERGRDHAITADVRVALEYIREHYADSYSARINLGSDLARHADAVGIQSMRGLGGEGVLQPIARYQQTPAEDVIAQIERKAGEDTYRILGTLISFASERAARGDDGSGPDVEVGR